MADIALAQGDLVAHLRVALKVARLQQPAQRRCVDPGCTLELWPVVDRIFTKQKERAKAVGVAHELVGLINKLRRAIQTSGLEHGCEERHERVCKQDADEHGQPMALEALGEAVEGVHHRADSKRGS